jgi:hypothetical protein
LHAGQYKLTASGAAVTADGPPFYGSAMVTLGKEDVKGVRVPGLPSGPLNGEVVWDGAAPDRTYDQKLLIDLNAPTRSFRSFGSSMEQRNARAEIPGQFSLPFILMDEYEVRVTGLPQGLYVKDIVYAGQSVKYGVLRVGSASGSATLKVLLGQDGGSVTAKVQDKDGHPVSDQNVVLMPATTPSDAQLAAMLVSGQTDQNGVFTSPVIEPGKYLVLATPMDINRTPEMITRLSGMRNRATEVELGPAGKAEVTLTVEAGVQ